uniref:Ankyrin repeat domain-containing protein n=1 Tax=Gouania willdenowi TaxID=441366 RepID=A0A8C5ERV4_GOUWI
MALLQVPPPPVPTHATSSFSSICQISPLAPGLDPRGRTPLHMAVSLGHLECVRVLLKHGAEVTKENAKNWTVLQEAVSTGDPEMVQIVLHHRDYLKFSTALGGVPGLLSKIRESPDFYMEMKWEFTSWIPLLSRVCPSDVCRIWKSGACLRVDTTLLDFENMTWIRGHRSYIFRGDAELLEVNHDDQVVETESFNILEEIGEVTFESMVPEKQEIAKRLTTPIVNTYLDTKDIAFERNKSGIWGWRTDRTETVNRFEAKVFSVNNVNIVIRTRTEHLTDEEKAQIKSERNILESLLGTVEEHISAQGDLTLEYATATNPTAITPEEYFNPNLDLGDRDIGRPIELSVRTQKFKGTLWMSEDHPLSLVEQVTPIIDIMAHTSSHFARLRDFLNLKFPPGFPVKIEIPLFHLLNARITFGKVNECSTEEEVKPTANSITMNELLQGFSRLHILCFIVVFQIHKCTRFVFANIYFMQTCNINSEMHTLYFTNINLRHTCNSNPQIMQIAECAFTNCFCAVKPLYL